MSPIEAPAQGWWSRFWRNAFAIAEEMETTEAELLESQLLPRITRIEERLGKLESRLDGSLGKSKDGAA